jgi:hypothetical protein
VPAVGPHLVAERRGLEVRQRFDDGVVAQPGPSRRNRPVVADEHRGAHEELGDVGGAAPGGGRAGRELEVADAELGAVDHDVPRIEATVRDASRVQRRDLAPEVGEHVVGDRCRIDVAESGTGKGSRRDQRHAGTRPSGDDHRRNVDVGPLRQQERVCLRLDVLQPRRVERGTAVLVCDRAPRLRQQLRIGFVTTEHAHQQLTVIVLRAHQRAAVRLLRQQVHVVRVDAELDQRGLHLGRRRSPTRRTEDQVHDRRDRPPERDGGERAVGQRRAQVQRGQRHEQDEELPDAPDRSRQVRRRDRDDHHEDGDAHRGKAGRVLVDAHDRVEAVHQSGIGDHECGDETTDRPRREPADRHVACQSPPLEHQRGNHHQAERPERADAVQQPEQ